MVTIPADGIFLTIWSGIESFSNTGRHSFPTVSYATIFLFPSRIFPTGSFNCCALVGHSGLSGVVCFGTPGVFVSGDSGFGGGLYAGGGGGSCSNTILFLS